MLLTDVHFNVPKRAATKNIIKVVGVGGGGCNAVSHMFTQGIKDVDFVICNTDLQALQSSAVPNKIQLGLTASEGLGAGAVPERGREAAIESEDEIRAMIDGSTKMVFITAGMGGGTGTGAAPEVAKICRSQGILTIGIVTVPFGWEGDERTLNANVGLAALEKEVDSIIIIENDGLEGLNDKMTMKDAFAAVDGILCNAAKSIAEMITKSSRVNVDFQDVRTVLKDSGRTIINTASASGEGRALKAIEAALNTPLISDNDIRGARRMLLFVSYGKQEMTVGETTEIGKYLQKRAGTSQTKTNLIWGTHEDESLGEEIVATIVAAGFDSHQNLKNNNQTATNPTYIMQGNGNMVSAPEVDAMGRMIEKVDISTTETAEITNIEKSQPKQANKSQKIQISAEENYDDDNYELEIPHTYTFEQDRSRYSQADKPVRISTETRSTANLTDQNYLNYLQTTPAFLRQSKDIGTAPLHSSQNNMSDITVDKNGNTHIQKNGPNGYIHKLAD